MTNANVKIQLSLQYIINCQYIVGCSRSDIFLSKTTYIIPHKTQYKSNKYGLQALTPYHYLTRDRQNRLHQKCQIISDETAQI